MAVTVIADLAEKLLDLGRSNAKTLAGNCHLMSNTWVPYDIEQFCYGQ